ncbi:hypothetical protein E8E11_008790 [Didymella keratinophila]|nr:hypothetical protein E8E11_008790 [Didymella keratinophila]
MAEIVDPAPPGLKWLKTLLPMISTLSIFGGSITFSVIPSINDEPPNQHMSARDVRLYLSLAWIFFLFALGMSTIGQAVIEFQDKALHVAMGGNVDGDADLIKRAMDAFLNSTTCKIAGALLLALLTWRTWKFTLRPLLHPNEPKDLPYWLPFVGHALSILRGFNNTVNYGVRYFQHSTGPFAMTVAGDKVYVATSSEDINTVWNNSKTLSLDAIAMEMFTLIGISQRSREALFEVHESARFNLGFAKAGNVQERVQDFHKQQLHNGPRLEALMSREIVPGLFRFVEFSDPRHPAVTSRSGAEVTISLFDLCVHAIIAEDTDAYFGPKLREMVPGVIEAFVDWEYTNWKFVMQMPDFLSRDMLRCKATVIDAFEAYYRLPRSERPGASHFVVSLEDMLREAGLTEKEMAMFTFLHYWAFVGNTYKLAFWLLAHLLHSPALLSQIREEVLPGVKLDSVDETYLLERCPVLDSLAREVLRLTVATSLARVIMSPCVIGGKALVPGRKIMLPISALHHDASIWGTSPAVLDSNRFVSNPKLAKSTSYRPWGGGPTMCPGRFFARRSVNALVAILLTRYELEVVSDEFPEMDGARPSPGIAPVTKGHDVKVKCTPRR